MPKKVIANLNIQVGASSATLRKDFKAGAGAVKGFARDVQGTAGRLRTFDAARDRAGRGLASFAGRAKSAALGLAGMVTAAAAAAISVRGVTGAFADLDRISKFSDAVGLSTETMAAWRHGAELTGTSTATLEKGVQRFARVLGDAQAGVGAAVRGFETLGLSVDELAKMNTAEAFKATAEAIKGIADPAQRAAAAYAVFGRQGQELMTFLTAGRDGIEAMEAEARTLGITFSREMGAKVEAANDAMARMGAATRGMAQQLAISLAPAIINVSEGLTSLAVYLGNVDLTTVKTALQIGAFAASLALVITIAPKIIAAIRGIIVALKAMTTASIIAQGVSGVGLAKVVVGLAAAGAVAYGVGRGFDQLTKETDAAANSTAKLGKQLQVALPEDLADPVDEAAEKMQKLAAENERWVSIGQRITASVATPLERLKEDLAETHEALRRGKVTWETYQRAVQKLSDDFLSAEGGAKRLASAIPTGGVAAAVKGTRSGSEAVRQSIAAGRQMTDHLKKLREAAKTREKQLAGIMDATYEVEEAIREDRTKIIRHRIPGA